MVEMILNEIRPKNLKMVNGSAYLLIDKDMLKWFALENMSEEEVKNIRFVVKAENSEKFGHYFGVGIQKIEVTP